MRDRDGLPKYKRSGSDDVYERLLKYNNESIKRAIKDGYRNFINPHITEENPPANAPDKPTRKRFARQEIERGTAPNNNEKLQINTLKHNKYITRTSKAGTLVIKEESFDNPNWRRRRRTLDGYVFLDDKENKTMQVNRMQNFRKVSDPNVSWKTKQPSDQYTSVEKTARENKKENVYKPQTNSLFHSKSAACVQSVSGDNNSDLNANYMVHEPTTPGSEQSRKGSEQLTEKIELKKRRKIRRNRRSDESATSSSQQQDNFKYKGNQTKGISTHS